MKLNYLSESQKGILMMMVFPTSLLLIGLGAAWLLLGSNIVEWLKLMSFQIIVDVVVFAAIGLAWGYYELKVWYRFMRHLKPDTRFVDRRAIVVSTVFIIGSCLLFYAIQYLGSDNPQKVLAEVAHYFTLGGLGFLVTCIVGFICTSIASIRSQLDS